MAIRWTLQQGLAAPELPDWREAGWRTRSFLVPDTRIAPAGKSSVTPEQQPQSFLLVSFHHRKEFLPAIGTGFRVVASLLRNPQTGQKEGMIADPRSARCRRLLPADHALDSPNCPCPESLAGVECEPWPAPPTGDSSGPAPLGCPLESESPSQNGSWCWFWRRCGLSLASPRQLSWLGLGKDVLHRWYHRSRPSGCRWTGGAEGPGGGGCCGRYGFPGDSRRLWG